MRHRSFRSTHRMLVFAALCLSVPAAPAAAESDTMKHDKRAAPRIEEVAGDTLEAGKEVEEVEEVKEVDAVENLDTATVDASDNATHKPHNLRDALGRLHPLLVHLPIGWLMLTLVLDIAVFMLGYAQLEPAGLFVTWGSITSFIPGILTGLLRLQSFEHDADMLAQVIQHRNVMFVSFAFALLVAIYRTVRRRNIVSHERFAYLGLLLIATVIMAFGGHLGGELVFGEDYLSF